LKPKKGYLHADKRDPKRKDRGRGSAGAFERKRKSRKVTNAQKKKGGKIEGEMRQTICGDTKATDKRGNDKRV